MIPRQYSVSAKLNRANGVVQVDYFSQALVGNVLRLRRNLPLALTVLIARHSAVTLVGVLLTTLPVDSQAVTWLPNPQFTPGAVFPSVTREQVCTPGYAKSVRHVSGKVKAIVYREYQVPKSVHSQGEVDHLIPLELGGSNDRKNLWFEPYDTQPWNAHVKDRLKAASHAAVCRGELSLRAVQAAIARDWTAAYRQRLRQP